MSQENEKFVAAVEAALPTIAQHVDRQLRTITGEQVGFILLTFQFGHAGPGRVASNVHTDDLQTVLRSTIQSLDHIAAIARARPH